MKFPKINLIVTSSLINECMKNDKIKITTSMPAKLKRSYLNQQLFLKKCSSIMWIL